MFSGSLLVTGDTAAPTWLLLSSSLLYSRSPGTNGVAAVLLITSLLSHSSSALRHLVALAQLHGVHDLNKTGLCIYSQPSTAWSLILTSLSLSGTITPLSCSASHSVSAAS
ncbi:hypothetical protein GG344DRAFT_84201 [Lentinula edodes]|nr:hypothetical protein GG344DRAFT_84201 [Lentinula edodes]